MATDYDAPRRNETDDMAAFSELVRCLRGTESRRFTTRDTPLLQPISPLRQRQPEKNSQEKQEDHRMRDPEQAQQDVEAENDRQNPDDVAGWQPKGLAMLHALYVSQTCACSEESVTEWRPFTSPLDLSGTGDSFKTYALHAYVLLALFSYGEELSMSCATNARMHS